MRVSILYAYDGSRFHGSQVQNSGLPTVTNAMHTALDSLGIKASLVPSGRTDSGVHALGQVAHIDLEPYWQDLAKLQIHLNKRLAPSILIRSIHAAPSSFHARFDATSRVYRYIISDKRFSPFYAPYVHFVERFDAYAIADAIKLFEGEHNFEFFKKSSDDPKTNYVRKIFQTRFYRHKEFGIFYFKGNAYLRSQIRMMVQFLLDLSDGKLSKQQLSEQLAAQTQHSTKLAPPNGLYLTKIAF
jgi:tRNA pseudouridine38-40 synthase